MKKYKKQDVINALDRYVRRYFSSIHGAAFHLGVSRTYLYYMLSGDRAIPDKVLRKLGYERHQPDEYYIRKVK